jgi:hypothetical protein
MPKRQAETLFAQFNPNELREDIRVDYNSVLPRRGSHEVINYVGTRSETIPLNLFFTGIDRSRTQSWGRLQKLANASSAGALTEPERFLKSCCYPDTGNRLFTPPTLIFDWPRIVRMRCKIRRVQFRWTHFSQRDGSGLILVARIRLQEVPGRGRIQGDQVRQFGSIRLSSPVFAMEAGMGQAETEGRQVVRSSGRGDPK